MVYGERWPRQRVDADVAQYSLAKFDCRLSTSSGMPYP